MNLRDLIVEGDKKKERDGKWVPVLWQAYHITCIFLHYLPKVDIDGNNKLVIFFKEKPEGEPQYFSDSYFHVSSYYVDNEVLEDLNALPLSIKDREMFYLDVLVDVLIKICVANKKEQSNIDMIIETARKVKECEFKQEIMIKKLSKTSSNRRYRASVFKSLDYNGEMWYLDLEDKKNKSIKRFKLQKEYSFVPKQSLFYISEWVDDKFIIRDRFGRIFVEIETCDNIQEILFSPMI